MANHTLVFSSAGTGIFEITLIITCNDNPTFICSLHWTSDGIEKIKQGNVLRGHPTCAGEPTSIYFTPVSVCDLHTAKHGCPISAWGKAHLSMPLLGSCLQRRLPVKSHPTPWSPHGSTIKIRSWYLIVAQSTLTNVMSLLFNMNK